MATPKQTTKAQQAAGMQPGPAVDNGIPAPQTTVDNAANAAGAAMQSERQAIVLEDNIPYPTRTFGGARRTESIYPFASMNIGQSFFIGSTPKMPEPWKTLTSLASRECRKQHPKVFVTGKEVKDGKVVGVRVWRKEDTDKPVSVPKKREPKAVPQAEAGTTAQESGTGAANPNEPSFT